MRLMIRPTYRLVVRTWGDLAVPSMQCLAYYLHSEELGQPPRWWWEQMRDSIRKCSLIVESRLCMSYQYNVSMKQFLKCLTPKAHLSTKSIGHYRECFSTVNLFMILEKHYMCLFFLTSLPLYFPVFTPKPPTWMLASARYTRSSYLR